MSDDPQWDRWTEDFHGAPPAPEDERMMLERARSETRKQWLSLAKEVLASAFLVAFYVAMLSRSRHPALVAMASANFVFVAAWLGYLVHVRRGTWRAHGESALEFLRLTRARREADVQWLRFARLATVAVLLFVAGWCPVWLSAHWARYAAEPWRAVVGFGGALVIGAAVLVYQSRKLARAEAELSALVGVSEQC